ncbi:MAG: glycosyltransferase family 2 protein [Desulfobacterales bacterium]|nr:glycosyltransferase family 2 protein [Desulfobacterales bacterium]
MYNHKKDISMTNTKKIELSIVIPCLQEAETLEGCIHEAFQAIEKNRLVGEVVVSDNGSTDGSAEIAKENGVILIHVPKKGYGNALGEGIKAARGKYILMGDADGSYDFSELPCFLEQLRKGYDLVMGCRFPKYGGRIESGAMPWKHRWIGNPILSSLGKLFFSSPVNDFHCGLRAFRRKSILDLSLKTEGMEFASEMVVKATLCKLKITQVPITLRPDGRSGSPHLQSWRDGWRHLRFMLLYSPKWLFILPGLVLAILGILGFILFLSKPVTIGSITFDLNSLLVSSTAILTGFQILAFGLFVKAYAVNAGLLPDRENRLNIIHSHPVEWGIAIGFVFVLAGLGIILNIILEWRAAGFGPLSYQDSLRTVILAVTIISLGIQAAVSGFALSILGLKR